VLPDTGQRAKRTHGRPRAIAEKVAKYRHAQLSAVRLAGDIDATVTDNASLDELLDKIKDELRALARPNSQHDPPLAPLVFSFTPRTGPGALYTQLSFTVPPNFWGAVRNSVGIWWRDLR
jgi:hypothetical protein